MTEIVNPENTSNHHGQNIAKFRALLGINQEELGKKMNMSQAQISKYEQMEIIDDVTLGKFSAALGVPIQVLKSYDHEGTVNKFFTYINTVNDGGTVTNTTDVNHVIINPLDAVMQLHKEVITLMEEKVAKLEAENEQLKKNK